MLAFELNKCNALDFKLNVFDMSAFEFEEIQSFGVLTEKNTLDFENIVFVISEFEERVRFQKITFWFVFFCENDIFCIFLALLRCVILNTNFLFVSDFDSIIFQFVIF